MEYLLPVQGLESAIFKDILDQACSFAKKNRRQLIAASNKNEASEARSLRSSLLDPVIGGPDDPDDSDSVTEKDESEHEDGENKGSEHHDSDEGSDNGGLEYC